jgi:hypothetical protein
MKRMNTSKVSDLCFRRLHALVSPEPDFPVENESQERRIARITDEIGQEKNLPHILADLEYYRELRAHGGPSTEPSVVYNLSDALDPGAAAFDARRRLRARLSELDSYIEAHRSRRIEPEELTDLRLKVERAAAEYSGGLRDLTVAMADNTHLGKSAAARAVMTHLVELQEALVFEQIILESFEAVVSVHNSALPAHEG